MLEGARHRRALRRIPVRVHVNGTRGKSSVCRLIAAGLRAGGKRTCAKTTGTLPRMIFPDGTEYPVFRPAGANILEQLRIIRMAAQANADMLVIECMAVQPPLQALCERVIVRSTHGVMTIARADHLDVMGPEPVDVALALAGTVPYVGKLFSGEREYAEIFANVARDRGTEVTVISQADVAAVPDDALAGFSYLEHAENVALALTVCESLGVARETALRGMWQATPDPGALTARKLSFFGRDMVFVNAFAANDPDSTDRIWQRLARVRATLDKAVVIVNCRADRADRSAQLAETCATWDGVDAFVLIGTGTFAFARAAAASGIPSRAIVFAENRRVEEVFEITVSNCGARTLVVGVANIGGDGLDLIRYFTNRSHPMEPRDFL